jgi:O-antigen ligase
MRLAKWLDHSLFWALLAVICLAVLPNSQWAKVTEAFGVSLIFLLGALRVVEGGLRGSWSVRDGQLLLPLLLLAAFAVAQTITPPALFFAKGEALQPISADPYGTLRFVSYLLAYMIFGELLLRYTSNDRRLSLLVHTLIGVGVALALFALVAQIVQQGPDGFHIQLRRIEFYGHLGNRNHFSMLMAMPLGLCLGLIFSLKAGRQRQALYVLSAMVMWSALILTNSRGGILSMFAQQLFCLLFLSFTMPAPPAESNRRSDFVTQLHRLAGKWVFRIALIAIISMLSVISVVWVGGDTLVDRVETAQTDLTTRLETGNEKEGRFRIWRATWQLIKESPVAGSGFGGFRIAISRHFEASGHTVPHQAHNDYLDLIAAGGVIGVALIGWFFVLWMRRARSGLYAKNHLRRAASFGALAGLFAVAIHSAFDFGLQLTTNALIFTTLLAIPLMDSKIEKAGAHKEISSTKQNSVLRSP